MREAALKALERRPSLEEVYQTTDGHVFLEPSLAQQHAKLLGTELKVVTRSELLEESQEPRAKSQDEVLEESQEPRAKSQAEEVVTPSPKKSPKSKA